MGILSLAHRGCRIASRPRTADGHVGHGWSVDLEPEHFTGRSDAQVRHDDGAPYPSGTAVQFEATESADMIRAAVASAARHYPLPVTFEGETLERRAFLDGAVHAESWNGLTFGVYRDRGRGYLEPDLNFFGLTVARPAADGRDRSPRHLVRPRRRSWTAPASNCCCRRAGRPSRTRFWPRCARPRAWRSYRAMAADSDPRPAFTDWSRARDAGIDLAPPPEVLRPWRPGIADIDDWRDPPKPRAGRSPTRWSWACDPEPPEAQALWRAVERAGMAEKLFEADKRLNGYGWYDRLDRVTGVDTEVTDGDGRDVAASRVSRARADEGRPRPRWRPVLTRSA